jgi:hypothetical protein
MPVANALTFFVKPTSLLLPESRTCKSSRVVTKEMGFSKGSCLQVLESTVDK